MPIQVRKSTYRGTEGYSVCGKSEPNGRPVSIFTPYEGNARAIQAAYKVSRAEGERVCSALFRAERLDAEAGE